MLFERFEKGGSDAGSAGGGGGGGARASPQKRGGVGPVAPAPRPGAAERKENIRRAHAPASQQEAIDNMKLAQQLRAAERDLDKVQRLHLSKSRRVMELEHELEEQIGGFESRKHELERISTERDSALRQLDEATRTIADLHSRAQFVRITNAGLRESHVHDVKITREAPNYPTTS